MAPLNLVSCGDHSNYNRLPGLTAMNYHLFAQTETYQPGPADAAAFLGVFIVSGIVALIIVAGIWKTFTKAGKPGWAVLVPFYNLVVLLEVVGRPLWWIVVLLIPGVNFIFLIIIAIDLAKSFGKGTGFAMGLIFLSPIFYPILGFGSARYQGPAAATA